MYNKDNQISLSMLKNSIDFIEKYMCSVEISDFIQNEILLASMMYRLILIAENISKICNEYKEKHNDIPWDAIIDLGNKIIHDYGNVDYRVVYKTLKQDIPSLKFLLADEEETR